MSKLEDIATLVIGAIFGAGIVVALALKASYSNRVNNDKLEQLCMLTYQINKAQVIDDSIYCIREEYILLENQNDK